MLIPKTYDLLCEAIESGVRYGLSRRCMDKRGLFSLTDEVLEFAIEEVQDAVLNSILERFDIRSENLDE